MFLFELDQLTVVTFETAAHPFQLQAVRGCKHTTCDSLLSNELNTQVYARTLCNVDIQNWVIWICVACNVEVY